MEQGHDGHGDVPGRQIEAVGQRGGVRVEDGGAVRVKDALGKAGGAAVCRVVCGVWRCTCV